MKKRRKISSPTLQLSILVNGLLYKVLSTIDPKSIEKSKYIIHPRELSKTQQKIY